MFMPLSSDKIDDKKLTQFFKELTVFGDILLNHTRAGPLRVVGKALNIISSGTLWRCIVVLKVAIWSKGSRVPSYESKKGILNLGDKGWPLMKPWKESLFDEPNHLWDSLFSCSPTSHPWPFSSDPFPSLGVAPFVKQYPLTGFQAQRFLYLLDSGLVPPHIFHGVASLDQSP